MYLGFLPIATTEQKAPGGVLLAQPRHQRNVVAHMKGRIGAILSEFRRESRFLGTFRAQDPRAFLRRIFWKHHSMRTLTFCVRRILSGLLQGFDLIGVGVVALF